MRRKKSQGQTPATRTVDNTRRAAKRYEARAMVTLSLRQQLEAGAPSASSARKATARVATRRSDVQRRRREGQRAHFSPLGSVAPRAQHLPQALEQPPLLDLVLERLRGGGRLLEDGRREAGELGDVDAVRSVAGAGLEAVEEGDRAAPLVDGARHVEERDVRVGALELAREGVVVRREEAAAARLEGEVAEGAVGDGHAVEGGGASAELVEDHERARGGVLEDERGLLELDAEGGEAGHDGVVRADPREDAVDGRERARLRRHPAAEVRHQHRQTRLPQHRRLAAHVRPRHQQKARRVALAAAAGPVWRWPHPDVVGDALPVGQRRLHAQVDPSLDVQEGLRLRDEGWAAHPGGATRASE
mmetsp:Transcript_38636/g.123972  ORF Transcript_38636/g.123972 Transcript_38636/m.123972 type:complete len:361 (-) Transcript_38636:1267-2349(-)